MGRATAIAMEARVAALNLFQHRRRSLFLGGALAAVTGLFVLLTALSAGVRDTMLRASTAFDTGHVNVGGFFKITSGSCAPLVTKYASVLEVVKREVPERERVVSRVRGMAKIISETGSVFSGLTGIDIVAEGGITDLVRIKSGNPKDLVKPGGLLVFETHADKLGVRVGDLLTVSAPTAGGVNNVLDATVVAIAHDIGMSSQWNMLISNDSLRNLYRLSPDATGVVMIYLRDIRKSAAVAERLRSALGKGGWKIMDHDPNPFWMKFDKVNREAWTGQKLDITIWEDEISFMNWVLRAMDALTFILVGIMLGIAVAGIMNVMWIAIRERTREIGTLRALGMQRRAVLRMFLLEALLLGLAGTLAGAVGASALAVVLNLLRIPIPDVVQLFLMSERLVFVLRPLTVVLGVAGITAVTGIAALYPALRAAKLKPVTAMGHAG